MKINLPVKIHNKFEIEVKDVVSGEIVQKGYAENIVLNNFFTSSNVVNISSRVGSTIAFGSGSGELDPARTTMFNLIENRSSEKVELVANQTPLPSYGTKKITILPAEHVGIIITEVGIGNSTGNATIYTHALIKDSEGNPLSLGPKTATQEITIYATVYFQPDFEPGITLYGSNLANNGLIRGFTCTDSSYIRSTTSVSDANYPYINGVEESAGGVTYVVQNGPGSIIFRVVDKTGVPIRYETHQINKKVNNVSFIGAANQVSYYKQAVRIDFRTLAQNNSTIWGGWEFDKTPIGTGDGSTILFTLPWDEVRLDKAKTVYVNGVAESGVTWTENSITFDTAPADQAVITADYWVDYIPKDSDHVLDLDISINYGEGTPT